MSTSSQRRKVWSVPTVLAVLTLLGLASALLGEHWGWKAVGWITLAVPVLVGVWFARPRRSRPAAKAAVHP
ncbi:hypothetical protein [Dyella sp. C9]|uniref:hypothetical protein n=1 Tax=Dyella sp. C9 TaxID=2202154 RepID=UPI000DEFAEBD|nr:hypothetical protein [Dyella sp. C9]